MDSPAVLRSSNREMTVTESVLSIIFVAATHHPLSTNAIADLLYPNKKRKSKCIENIIGSLLSIVYSEEGMNIV